MPAAGWSCQPPPRSISPASRTPNLPSAPSALSVHLCRNSEERQAVRFSIPQIPPTCGAARIDHDIDSARNERPCHSQNLPDASTDSVPANGHADFPRRGQPHAAVIESIGEQKDNKGARILSRAPLVNRLEFSGVLELEKPRGLLSSAQPKRACVPCHAELSRPTGLLASSCAHENHASWHDACCWVGMFSLAFLWCSLKRIHCSIARRSPSILAFARTHFCRLKWKNESATLSRLPRRFGHFWISTARGNLCGNLVPSPSGCIHGYLGKSS